MLILTRKLGESIAIGDHVKITLLEVKGKQVRIGIEAPKGIPVHRGEIYQLIQEENINALDSDVTNGALLSDVWTTVKQGIFEKAGVDHENRDD